MSILTALIIAAIIAFVLWIIGGRVAFPGEIRTVALVVWITCLVVIIVLLVFGRTPLRL